MNTDQKTTSIKIHKLVSDYEPKNFKKLIRGMTFPEPVGIKNKKIGILVGSRGINNIDKIILRLIEDLKKRGGIPCIIPAMGSHGSGTPKGQISLLEKLGISTRNMGVKVISSGRVTEIGRVFGTSPVFINEAAGRMDMLIGINRIKPHTRFSGKYESGILKLLSAGLGGFRGADHFHRALDEYGFEDTIIRTAGLILDKINFLYFIGIIEDRRGATSDIHIISPSKIIEKEKQLLNIAKKNMPSIPFADIDLLIVNEMGKNISGAGMDPCVIGGKAGRKRIAKRIYVRRLSAATEGNAFGMGAADFISSKFFRSIDFDKTYKNAFSSINLDNVKVPIWFKSDLKAVQFAAESLRKPLDDDFRIVWIDNTINLKEMYISSNLSENNLGNYKLANELKLSFTGQGNMKIE